MSNLKLERELEGWEWQFHINLVCWSQYLSSPIIDENLPGTLRPHHQIFFYLFIHLVIIQQTFIECMVLDARNLEMMKTRIIPWRTTGDHFTCYFPLITFLDPPPAGASLHSWDAQERGSCGGVTGAEHLEPEAKRPSSPFYSSVCGGVLATASRIWRTQTLDVRPILGLDSVGVVSVETSMKPMDREGLVEELLCILNS